MYQIKLYQRLTYHVFDGHVAAVLFGKHVFVNGFLHVSVTFVDLQI
jgi:hypothetical protein